MSWYSVEDLSYDVIKPSLHIASDLLASVRDENHTALRSLTNHGRDFACDVNRSRETCEQSIGFLLRKYVEDRHCLMQGITFSRLDLSRSKTAETLDSVPR